MNLATLILIVSVLALGPLLQELGLLAAAIRSVRRGGEVSPAAAAGAPVTVIVPCYDEARVLRLTVEAILASQDVCLHRIVLVDDGSTDDTRDVMDALHARHGGVIAVLTQPNGGKAVALNHGLSVVETDLLVTVDADTQVAPGALRALVDRLGRPAVAAVSGHMLVGNRRPANRLLLRAQEREYEGANNVERRALSAWGCVTTVPGAVGGFRTAAVRAAGGYPEGTLAEDAELTFRLLLGGHRVVHEPRALVLTEAPDTLRGLLRQRVRWSTGKLQVLGRCRREAWRAGVLTAGLWVHTGLNQAIIPLAGVGLSGAFGVALLAGLWTVATSAAPTGGLLTACGTAVAVVSARAAVSIVATGFARRLDAGPRRHLGLAPTLASASAALVAPWVHAVALATAWFRVLRGSPTAWNKVRRTGDVRLPQAEMVVDG